MSIWPMCQVTLQFDDVLRLVEFLSVVGRHDLNPNIDKMLLTGTLSDAAIELAVNGYGASLVSNQKIA